MKISKFEIHKVSIKFITLFTVCGGGFFFFSFCTFQYMHIIVSFGLIDFAVKIKEKKHLFEKI